MGLCGLSIQDAASVAACSEPVGCSRFFSAIRKECEKTERPEGYHSDVFRWDRLYSGGPCIWVLRVLGTHIFPLTFESEGEIRGCGGKTLEYLDHTFSGETYYYCWDGSFLHQVTLREAVELLEDAADESRRLPDFQKNKPWGLWG